jgi:hypothetical protein
MRVLEPTLVDEQLIVHLPEPSLEARGLSCARRGPGSRMARADRKVSEHVAELEAGQLRAERRAIWALEVGVLDQEWCLLRSPKVIVRAERRERRRAKLGQGAPAVAPSASASKIRFAPGSSDGEAAR